MRILLRIVIGVLTALIVVIATVPLLVLRDLNSGGTGWGLCPDGLDECSTSYFAGFELLAWLSIALLMVAVVLRVAVKTLRRVEHGYDRNRAEAAMSPERAQTPPRRIARPGSSPVGPLAVNRRRP